MSFGVQVSIATISTCRPVRIFCQNRHESRRSVTVFLGRLHEVRIGCRNPREKVRCGIFGKRDDIERPGLFNMELHRQLIVKAKMI